MGWLPALAAVGRATVLGAGAREVLFAGTRVAAEGGRGHGVGRRQTCCLRTPQSGQLASLRQDLGGTRGGCA
eukprot:9629023-Alexandrium_andersonii.AAC.1